MQLLKYFFTIFICASTYSQTIYELAPGSKNNLFDLNLANSTKSDFQSVNITVQEAPAWIEFDNNEMRFNKIKTSEKQTAQFYFNISETAIIGEKGKVNFRITDQTGRSWLKSYDIKVILPQFFEVYQNYPNPFNPSTTIKYSIPQDALVKIKVFNVLGEEISVLVNKEMKTGIHEVEFSAKGGPRLRRKCL